MVRPLLLLLLVCGAAQASMVLRGVTGSRSTVPSMAAKGKGKKKGKGKAKPASTGGGFGAAKGFGRRQPKVPT